MAQELSTAGIALKYVVESTAGTRPTSGYTGISGIKSIASINPEPNVLEVTDLSDTVWKRYIKGLKDPGGVISFGANLTDAFKTAWAACVTAYGNLTGGKGMWFEIVVPTIGSFYFRGEPDALGFDGADVDSVLEINAHVIPNEIEGWGTSSST